jgi:glutamate racemase
VNWIDPAPAIARRVADLLAPGSEGADRAGAKVIFTSGRSHGLPESLAPFFGGQLPV